MEGVGELERDVEVRAAAAEPVDEVLGGVARDGELVGQPDMVVVDSGDAVLVVPRDRSQDVRSVVQSLKARGLGKFE